MSAVTIGVARGGLEIKQFFRQRDSMVFSFLLPIAMLLLFGMIFGNMSIGGGFTYSQALLPSMLTMGIVSTSLVSIGIWICVDRDYGTLRRLVSTPMPRASYFIGKVVMVVVVGFIESALLIAAGVLAYGVKLPQTAGQWLTLLWVGVLSFAVLGVLGVAISSLPRTSRSAAAVIQFPVLLLQFVSGIFIPFTQLPEWIQDLSSFFPLRWIAQGFRAAFLPDYMAKAEPSGSWEYGTIVLVLLAWLIAGLIVCVTTFRWKRRSDG